MRGLTVDEAARRFGYSVSHIRGLCQSKLVKAEKFGRMWVINETSLAHYASQPHPTGPVPKERRS